MTDAATAPDAAAEAAAAAAATAKANEPNIAEFNSDTTPEAEAARIEAEAAKAAETAAVAEKEAADAAKAADEAKANGASEAQQRAFNKIAFEKREAERKYAAAVEELERLKAGSKEAQKEPNDTMTRAEAEAWARQEAVRIAEQNRVEADARAKAEAFNAQANKTYETGKAAFPDFEQAVNTLRNLGHMTFDVVDTAHATDDPAKVLHFLGTNLAEAERIFALTPARQAVEFAKIAGSKPAEASAKEPEKKEVSKAPAPVKPLEGSATITSELRDEDSDLEWGKKFEKRFYGGR